MHFGLNQAALNATDPASAFELAAAAGAEGVEVTCERGDDLSAVLGPEAAEDLSRLKDQHGLHVPSLSLGILKQDASLFGPASVADQAAQLVTKAIDTARRVEAGVVLIPFFGKAAIESEDELGRVLEALPDLAEQAEQAGVVLGVESTLNVDQQRHLVASLSHYGSVKLYYDVGDALARRQDPATSLRELGKDSICQVHLKDVRLTEGKPPDWNVALGDGDVDFPGVANALKAVGYDGWVVLESPAGEPVEAAAKANLDFARQLLAE